VLDFFSWQSHKKKRKKENENIDCETKLLHIRGGLRRIPVSERWMWWMKWMKWETVRRN